MGNIYPVSRTDEVLKILKNYNNDKKEKEMKKIRTNHTPYQPVNTELVLKDLSDTIIKSYGPTGASTLSIKSDDNDKVNKTSITKDGYNLITTVEYEHPFAESIRRLLLDSMMSVLETSGDGTTTTTILLERIHKKLNKLFQERKLPPQIIQNIARRVVDDIIVAIDKMNEGNLITQEDMTGIIQTSTNSDSELCDVLYDVVNELSDNGKNLKDMAIHFKADGITKKTKYEISEGYNIPSACVGLERTASTTKEAEIMIINGTIGSPDEYVEVTKLMQKIISYKARHKNKIPTVLVTWSIANRNLFEQEYIKLKNWYNKTYNSPDDMPVYLLEYPNDGTVFSIDTHHDLQYLLGQSAPYILGSNNTVKDLYGGDDNGLYEGKEDMSVNDYVIDQLAIGEVATAKVIFGGTSTILKNIKGIVPEAKTILENKLIKLQEEAKSDGDKYDIRSRLLKISGKYATITVGGENEWDIRKKEAAVEDCVYALKSASESSVCGGMSTYIVKAIKTMNTEDKGDIYKDILVIIFESYNSLGITLLTNAGLSEEFADNLLTKYVNYKEENESNNDYIRKAIDIREIINILSLEKDVTPYEVLSKMILNTVAAEKKILEASMSAALTLIGINQVVLPDSYDIPSYNSDEAL